MTVYPIDIFYLRFVSIIYIDFFYTLSPHCNLIVSAVSVTSHYIIECYILMLDHDSLSLIYFIALCISHVFDVQRCRTLWFSAI